jgi:hypothetical protein
MSDEKDFKSGAYILVTFKSGEVRGNIEMQGIHPEQMAALALFLETYAQISMSEVIMRNIADQKSSLLLPRH